jgi:MFS family permease
VVFFRIGCGILDSSVHAYVSKSFKNQQSALFIKLDMFWYIGAVISPLFVSILLYLDIDTRYAFIGFFVLILLVLLLFFKFFNGLKQNSQNDFKNPVEKNKKTAVEKQEDSKTIAGEQLNRFVGHGNTYVKIIKNPVILLCTAGLFFYIGIFSLLSTWLTTYFADFGISVAFSSAVLSGFWAFNAISLFITGRIIRRFNEKKFILLCAIIGAICTVFYSMFQNIYVKIIFLVLQAIFYSSFFPILNSIAVRQNEKSCGTVLGITLSASVIGLVFFQPVSGSVMEYFGKDGVNYLLLATSVLLLVSILTLYLKIAKQNKK